MIGGTATINLKYGDEVPSILQRFKERNEMSLWYIETTVEDLGTATWKWSPEKTVPSDIDEALRLEARTLIISSSKLGTEV